MSKSVRKQKPFAGFMALMMVLTLSFLVGFTKSDASISNSDLSDQMQSQVNDLLKQEMVARHWKLVDSTITLQSIENSDSKVSAIFGIHATHLLDYASPEDVPIMKGKLQYVADNKVSGQALDSINKDIAMWKSDLQTYITTPLPYNNVIKAEGSIDSAGKLGKESVAFYVMNEAGEWIPYTLSNITTPDEAEKNGYDGLKAQVQELQTKSQNDNIAPTAVVPFIYDRLAARDYGYSSNPTKVCQSGSTTTQDASYYNSQYTYYNCNDCANYVSQCLYKGGIPKDSTWSPGSASWIQANTLISYMLNKGYIYSATANTCVAGYPMKVRGQQHVELMVYNDGQNRLANAHTNDKYWVPYYDTMDYYQVPQVA